MTNSLSSVGFLFLVELVTDQSLYSCRLLLQILWYVHSGSSLVLHIV